MWSMSYGTVPDRAKFLEHCAKRVDDDGEPDPLTSYPMELVDSGEWEAVKRAVNRGIDSHLEAVSVSGVRIVDRKVGERIIARAGRVVIDDPGSLHTLIRRLVEGSGELDPGANEGSGDPGLDLVSAILYTLDIEWV